jgi:hypothetical protein
MTADDCDFDSAYAADPADPGPDPAQQPGAAPNGHASAPDWEKPLLEAVAELNRKHFVVWTGGQGIVATLTKDESLNRELLVFSQRRDIILFYENRHYLVGHTKKGEEVWKSLGEAWLKHRNRLTFNRIALIPRGPVPPGTFNLWRGFGVKPKPGKWSLIRQYLLEVICAGNESDFQWLLRWIARAVQHPEDRAETAVVLRGKKGAGKGTFGRILHLLFCHHSLQISSATHFTGRFNGHLVDVLFLFVDEAFWAGDKVGEAQLKRLVTEPTIAIEPKFVNLFQTPNRLKILMAANADWVVPATPDERRYFVLDVAEDNRDNGQYFDKLYQAINGAELPALLDYLLKLDISDFDHRRPPHTAALNQQKLVGDDSLGKFWLDCLTLGEIVGTDGGVWPEDVVKQTLHDAYVAHAHDHGDRHPMSNAIMTKKLAELIPGKILRSTRPLKPAGDVARPPRYILPSLDECRAAFLEAKNINKYAWPAPPQEDSQG